MDLDVWLPIFHWRFHISFHVLLWPLFFAHQDSEVLYFYYNTSLIYCNISHTYFIFPNYTRYNPLLKSLLTQKNLPPSLFGLTLWTFVQLSFKFTSLWNVSNTLIHVLPPLISFHYYCYCARLPSYWNFYLFKVIRFLSFPVQHAFLDFCQSYRFFNLTSDKRNRLLHFQYFRQWWRMTRASMKYLTRQREPHTHR